jgi:hypothetical protein
MLVDFLMIHIELPMPITTGKLRTIRAAEILKDIDATEDDRKEIADLVLALWLRSEDQRKGTSMDGAAGPRIINWLKRRLGWQSDRPQPRIHPMAAQVTSNAPAA